MKRFCSEYLEIIQKEYSGLNLTRIIDPDEFFEKHVQDTLIPLQENTFFEKQILQRGTLLDVGFGGGFPLLVLAKKYPMIKIRGIEARKKKSLAVNEIAKRLNLFNVETIHCRLENFFLDRPAVITFKAVGKIEEYLKLIQTDKILDIFFFKGPSVYHEENLEVSGFQQTHHHYYKVGENERNLFAYQNVPRGTANLTTSKKQLVKFSSIL